MATDRRDASPPAFVVPGKDAGDGRRHQAALTDRRGARLGPAAALATTEHFNLQSARSLTVSEANGRASIYLAALSSNLIARRRPFGGDVARGDARPEASQLTLTTAGMVAVVNSVVRAACAGLALEAAGVQSLAIREHTVDPAPRVPAGPGRSAAGPANVTGSRRSRSFDPAPLRHASRGTRRLRRR